MSEKTCCEARFVLDDMKDRAASLSRDEFLGYVEEVFGLVIHDRQAGKEWPCPAGRSLRECYKECEHSVLGEETAP